MISKQTIDDILSVAKIEEVVGEFVQLKRRGQNWVGLCPFHNDRSPSLYVSPRLGIYKCFVCGAGGDSVRFLMEHEKMSYPEALRHIAAKYGIRRAYLFGSYAKGLANENSDVDLLIEKGRPLSLLMLSGMLQDAREAIGLPVDIVTTTGVDDEFRSQIAGSEVLIYEG